MFFNPLNIKIGYIYHCPFLNMVVKFSQTAIHVHVSQCFDPHCSLNSCFHPILNVLICENKFTKKDKNILRENNTCNSTILDLINSNHKNIAITESQPKLVLLLIMHYSIPTKKLAFRDTNVNTGFPISMR